MRTGAFEVSPEVILLLLIIISNCDECLLFTRDCAKPSATAQLMFPPPGTCLEGKQGLALGYEECEKSSIKQMPNQL
jgi:hypothetical protein